jgi:sulfite reductase (ferredoxin)
MSGIKKYLVRYGSPGFVGCVGTVHSSDCQRGDRVVISTDRGEELAEVMVAIPASDERVPTGELLRMASPDDVNNDREFAARAAEVLRETQVMFAKKNIANAAVDSEVLLGGACCVVYYMGTPSIALGPLTIDLSQELGLRVQFQQLDSVMPTSSMPASPAAPVEKLPAAEQRKLDSQFLRGNLKQWMDGESRLSSDDSRILEFHGVYPQRKRRELSDESAVEGSTSDREFMLRIKNVGGRFSTGQFTTLLDIATGEGGGSLRLTSRQGVQLHGFTVGTVKSTMQRLESKLLTTFGACGDVARSVMCSPLNHLPAKASRQIRSVANELGKVLLPSSKSYYELWFDDLPSPTTVELEPIYGATYLPHKFKIAVGLPEDNSVDLLSQDVGLLAIVEQEQMVGFNVYIGGGQAFVEAKHVVQIVVGLLELYREHGNRESRKIRRFKYLVDDWGVQRISEELHKLLGEQMIGAGRGVEVVGAKTLIGWQTQSDGRLSFGIPVAGGRIEGELLAELGGILREVKCGVCVTAKQNLLLVDIEENVRDGFEWFVNRVGGSKARLIANTMACPALLSCRLALGNAEAIASDLNDVIGLRLAAHQREDFSIDLRVSGCPNGCARPMTAEIGVIAFEKDVYSIRLGGCPLGNRLNIVYKSNVETADLPRELGDIVELFCEEAERNESLGDFYHRKLSSER